jgi:hypothetical protein
MLFLATRFRDSPYGEQIIAVFTGTAGIGKTMFALYAARHYFDNGDLVLLYWVEHGVQPFTIIVPLRAARIRVIVRHGEMDCIAF